MGRTLWLKDDPTPCDQPAVAKVMLHAPDGDQQPAQLCQHHMDRTIEATDPSEGYE